MFTKHYDIPHKNVSPRILLNNVYYVRKNSVSCNCKRLYRHSLALLFQITRFVALHCGDRGIHGDENMNAKREGEVLVTNIIFVKIDRGICIP